jgi:hypothetical protein
MSHGHLEVSTRCGLALAVLMVAPTMSSAADWQFVPRASIGAGYETNPRGASKSSREDDAYAGVGTAELRMSADTTTSRYSFSPRADGSIYSGTERSSDLDYLNYYLPLGFQWRRQMSRYDIDGGYSKISTRSFPSIDPNNPTLTPTQQALLDEYMERWDVSPRAVFQISPRDLLDLSMQLDDVTFSESRITGRSDYKAASLDSTWTRSLNPRQQLSLTANASAFLSEIRATQIENDTLSYGLYAGYEYLWSDSTSLGVTAGAAHSEIEVSGLPGVPTAFGLLPCFDPVSSRLVNCTIKSDDENFIGQAFLRSRAGETITTELRVGRSIEPSSDGAQVTQDTFRAYISKELSAHLSMSAGGTYSKQRAVGRDEYTNVTQRLSREWWSAQAGVGWKLSRTWQIRADYAYYLDEYDRPDYEVSRHRVDITLQYSGLSRN